MRTRRGLAALCVLLPGLAFAASGGSPARLDQIARIYQEKGHFSGAALVARDGKVLLEKTYGAQAGTRYPIGCITLQFTAAAVLLLQQNGKLHLDDPLANYLPEAPAAWSRITLRQLLLHRAGLGGFGSFPETRTLSPDTLMKRAFENFPAPEPDKISVLSPWGYILLGIVIERTSGMSYGDFLAKSFFTPLGMTATAYRPDDPAALPTASLFSAGGLVSTPHDLAIWETVLYGGKVLSPASLRDMSTPPPGEFHSMGLLRKSGYGHPYFIHDAVLVPDGGGFLMYRPEDRAVIAVLGATDEGVSYQLTHALADASRGEKALTRWERGSTAQPNVLIPTEKLVVPSTGRQHGLFIYVPPGYSDHPERRYPVIYMQGGEDLFDLKTYGSEWQVDETLNRMARTDGFEAIVVGIDSSEKWMAEYNPYPGPPLKEAEGADYMRFVVEVVKPYVDRTYRTLPDRAHTAMMGASMGGLISHYALQAYPQVFSKYGLLSTSYWASPELVERAQKQALPPDTRIYLYIGGEENAPMEQDTRAMATILARQGRSEDVALRVDPGGDHSTEARRLVFPDVVRWLFRPSHGSPASGRG